LLVHLFWLVVSLPGWLILFIGYFVVIGLVGAFVCLVHGWLIICCLSDLFIWCRLFGVFAGWLLYLLAFF
jgi:hypothetical protein